MPGKIGETMTRFATFMILALMIGIIVNTAIYRTPFSEFGSIHSLGYLIGIYCALLLPAVALIGLLSRMSSYRLINWVYMAVAGSVLIASFVIMPPSQEGVGLLVIYGIGFVGFSLYNLLKPLSDSVGMNAEP